jgi:hypothetical protein
VCEFGPLHTPCGPPGRCAAGDGATLGRPQWLRGGCLDLSRSWVSDRPEVNHSLGKTSDLLRKWRRHGHDIGFGVGISRSYDPRPDCLAEPLIKTAMGTLSDPASERRSVIGATLPFTLTSGIDRRCPLTDLASGKGNRLSWVATCPWHPGFPASAIRSVNGPSSALPRFRA